MKKHKNTLSGSSTSSSAQLSRPSQKTAKLHYYDLEQNWARIEPHLSDPELNDILVENFNKYTYGRWREPFHRGQVPAEFESADWWIDFEGEHPEYWMYVKHAACHWLVNFAAKLATLVEPDRPWRIISSDRHSTVWDGQLTLFEFNYQAFGIPPEDCFEMAYEDELKPGEYLDINFAEHYTEDIKRRALNEPSSVS